MPPIVTLSVFVLSWGRHLGEALRWQKAAGFTLIACGPALFSTRDRFSPLYARRAEARRFYRQPRVKGS